MSRRPRLAAALALLLIGAACLTGCSKATQPGPPGDDTGEHLLAFVTDRTTPGDDDVALYDLDVLGFHSVAGLNSTAIEADPCVSDDGSLIAFASTRPGGAGGYDLYIYDRLYQTLLSKHGMNSATDETGPAFTHDSARLVFARIVDGRYRVKMYEPAGDTLVALPGLDLAGAWSDWQPSPNLHGDRIAFTSNRAGRAHVYVWDRGIGVLNLPDLVSDSTDWQPSLSADGRWLAFSSNRARGVGGYDVYLYDLVNHAFVRTPRLDSAIDEVHPSVSADGATIAFQSHRGGVQPDTLAVWTASDSTRNLPPNLNASSTSKLPRLRWR